MSLEAPEHDHRYHHRGQFQVAQYCTPVFWWLTKTEELIPVEWLAWQGRSCEAPLTKVAVAKRHCCDATGALLRSLTGGQAVLEPVPGGVISPLVTVSCLRSLVPSTSGNLPRYIAGVGSLLNGVVLQRR